jgi:CHRD domain-containing protein
MHSVSQTVRRARRVAMNVLAIWFATAATCASGQEVKVVLSGNQEIPPVTTAASGIAMITVGADRSMIGNVTITGMTVTVAHIHDAAAGANGPIIVPLTRTADNVWSVPAGTRLTDAQYESYKAGNLYLNIHSEAHRSGEIRGQIKP